MTNFQKLFLCIFIMGIFVFTLTPIVSSDFGYHFKIGEYIFQNHHFPMKEIFSYAIKGKEIVCFEWLGQVMLYLAYNRLGETGVAVLKSSFIAATFGLLLGLLFYKTKNYYGSFLLTIITLLATAGFYKERPFLITNFFVVFYLFILELFEQGYKKIIYFLPLIMLFWVNAHGGFPVGIVLIGIYLISYLLTKEKEKFLLLTKILIITIIACFINPYFHKIVFYPFYQLSQNYSLNIIREWLPLPTKLLSFKIYILFLIITALSYIFSHIKKNAVDFLGFLIFAIMGLYSSRHLPISFLILSSISAKSILSLWPKSYLSELPFKEKYHKIIITLIAILSLLIFIVNLFKKLPITEQSSREFEIELPVSAVQFIKTNQLSPEIFNPYNWGGYLIWQLYPDYRVFIDGRSDVYGDEFLKEYYESDLKDLIKKYPPINFILWPKIDWRLDTLVFNSEWKLIYQDDIGVILVKNISKNKDLIEKFTGLQFHRVKPSLKKLYLLGHQYKQKGEIQQAMAMWNEAINLDPKYSSAYLSLGVTHLESENPKLAKNILLQALILDPYNGILLYNLGLVFFRLGDSLNAQKYWKKAIIFNPELIEPHYNLAIYYEKLGKINKAIQHLQTILKYHPGDKATLLYLKELTQIQE